VKLALSEEIMKDMSPALSKDAYSNNVVDSVQGKSNLLRL
jgi:hypothetical protein